MSVIRDDITLGGLGTSDLGNWEFEASSGDGEGESPPCCSCDAMAFQSFDNSLFVS
jgi:hypothetical protein